MDEKRLLPDPIVCRRYGVSAMTIWRWEHDPQLDFPKAIRIRRRKYRDESDSTPSMQGRRRPMPKASPPVTTLEKILDAKKLVLPAPPRGRT